MLVVLALRDRVFVDKLLMRRFECLDEVASKPRSSPESSIKSASYSSSGSSSMLSGLE